MSNSSTARRRTALPVFSKASLQPAAAATDRDAPGLREALGIWGVFAVLTVAVLATYARVPLAELYHVSRGGIGGGASRVVTYLNYPGAFLAVALLGIAVARLVAVPVALSSAARWAIGIVAIAALGLCLVAALPGVVSDANLDARPINALPALGVALAAGLTMLALRRVGPGTRRAWTTGDWLRLGVVVVLAALALPWILADFGVYVGDVPLIGHLFMSKQILAGDPLPAVHLGEHHGLDGVLLATAALVLTRPLGQVRSVWLRAPLSFYLALMMAYGLGNAGNDWSLEQLVKRGTIAESLPDVIRPDITLAWGVILLATVVVGALILFVMRPRARAGA
ncbi:MAG TPA: hypothetical protein VFN57_03580 [Thermomicrobiaceae bacterium]|nr:hypothetical protein [Thermomicrobiaceae bacterium]